MARSEARRRTARQRRSLVIFGLPGDVSLLGDVITLPAAHAFPAPPPVELGGPQPGPTPRVPEPSRTPASPSDPCYPSATCCRKRRPHDVRLGGAGRSGDRAGRSPLRLDVVSPADRSARCGEGSRGAWAVGDGCCGAHRGAYPEGAAPSGRAHARGHGRAAAYAADAAGALAVPGSGLGCRGAGASAASSRSCRRRGGSPPGPGGGLATDRTGRSRRTRLSPERPLRPRDRDDWRRSFTVRITSAAPTTRAEVPARAVRPSRAPRATGRGSSRSTGHTQWAEARRTSLATSTCSSTSWRSTTSNLGGR